MTLQGAEVGEYTGARFSRQGNVETGVQAMLGSHAQQLRPLILKIGIDVPAGEYNLELKKTDRWLKSSFKLIVVAVQKAALDDLKAIAPKKPGASQSQQRAVIDKLKKPVPEALPSFQVSPGAERFMHYNAEAEARKPVVEQFYPRQNATFGGYVWIHGIRLSKVPGVLYQGKRLTIVSQSDETLIARLPPASSFYLNREEAKAIQLPLKPSTTSNLRESGPLQVEIPQEASIIANPPPMTIADNYVLGNHGGSFFPDMHAVLVGRPLRAAYCFSDESGVVYDRAQYVIRYRVYGIPEGWPVTMREMRATLASFSTPYPTAIEYGAFEMNSMVNLTSPFIELSCPGHMNWKPLVVEGLDPRTPSANTSKVGYESVVIDDTWEVRNLIPWELTSSWGQTQGESDFGAGKVEVGLVKVADDMAFRIASGPVGTRAVWETATEIPPGVIFQFEWEESVTHPKDQKPKARVDGETGGYIQNAFGLDRLVSPPHVGYRTYDDKGSGYTDEVNNGYYHLRYIPDGEGGLIDTHLDPAVDYFLMKVALNAEETVVNDHRVTLRLRRLRITYPSGCLPQDLRTLQSYWVLEDGPALLASQLKGYLEQTDVVVRE